MKKGFGFIFAFLLISFFSVAVHAENLQDDAIYHVAVDRFYNGTTANDGENQNGNLEHFLGGDLQGVSQKLDYIKGMGFTVVSLSPIFQNEANGYHGRWVKDFKKVDEHFGTMQDLKMLIKEAHKRDLKVMIDFVFETGPNHPWLSDPAKKNWFIKESTMFDTSQPDVQTFLLDVAKWWIKEADIDGFRLINAEQAQPDFWKTFCQEVKTMKENFFIVADIGDADPNTYQQTGFDAVMNESFALRTQQAFSKKDASLSQLPNFTSAKVPVVSFIDDEDIVRLTRKAADNKEYPPTRLRLALLYLYATPTIPFVNYGTEIALNGGKGAENDLMMDFRTSTELVEYITSLAEIRKLLSPIRESEFRVLYDKNGMLVYTLTNDHQTAVVAINNTSKTQKAMIGFQDLPENQELRGFLKGGSIPSEEEGYPIILERETAEIFKLDEKRGASMPFIAMIISIPILFIIFLYAANKRGKRKQPS